MASKQSRISQIRRTAFNYEQTYIMGGPNDIYIAGAIARCPKCIAIYNWKKALWTLAETRVNAILALPVNDDQELNGADLDFTSIGDIPYSIIELFNEFNSLPNIISISPTNGVAGTTVTITGTGFVGITAVTFNGVNATSFNVVSSTSITAVCPTGFICGHLSVANSSGLVISQQAYVRQ